MKPRTSNFISHSSAKALKNHFPGLLLATLFLSVSAVRATTYKWDSDGVFGNGQTDGGGTISSTNLDFMNATADVAWAGSSNSVVFGVAGAAAGSSYTVNNAYATDGFQPFALTFQGGSAYTLTGNRINVGAGAANGLRLNADVTATQTLGLGFAVYNGTFFTNNATSSAGLFNITGGIITQAPTGGGLLTLAGTGTGMNTMSGSMSQSGQGALALAVTGGAWTLSSTTSTYTGAITVNGGLLSVSSDANLGGSAGTISVSSASTGGTGVTFGSAPKGSIGVGTVILGSTVGAATSSTAFTLNGNANQTIASATNVDYATAATLNLDGGVFQATGTFSLSESKNTTTANRAIVLGNTYGGGTIQVTGANVLTAPGIVSGAGALTKTDTGTLVLTGANTYTGTTSVQNGTVSFNSVTAGAAAQALGASNTVNLGAVGASSGILYYTGGAGTLDKNINALGNGSDTIQNNGSGLLTLSGTLTKNGTVLKLNGGSSGINVTGTIAGILPSSDLYVNGGTVTLSAANSYTGPTFVNTGATLVLGINNAVPSNSALTLGDATTTGTLNMGAFTNSLGSLAFGAGHGTLKLAADQTSSAQLVASGTVVLGTSNTIDLTGMSTSAGLYKLVSGSSLTGTFGTVTALNSNYKLLYSGSELDAQHKATAALALGSNAPNVRVGSQTVNLSIGNTAPTGSADLSYTLGGLTGSGTRVAAAGSSAATGTYTANAGVNSFNITVTDGNATNSPQTVAFSQTGYNAAAANTISAVNLGKVRVGGTFGTSALSLTNTAAATYTEGLNASVSSTTGVATASGSVTNLAGASSSTALSVGLGGSAHTGTSGVQSGNVVIGLESNGTISGLTSLGLGSQTIGVSGAVYDFADAAFSKTAGAGTLTANSGTSYALDFGTGLALNTSYTATFQLANILLSGNGYQDNLGGTYALTGASQFATTASSFSGLTAGGTNSFTVTFFTGTTGNFSGTLALAGLSQQSGLSDASLSTINIAIAGAAIPEPDIAALLGGFGVLTLLRRRR